MKKTLIALAAVAAATGAMAQATISGTVAYGFQSTKTVAGQETSGFGVETSEIRFAASEDLGGGLTASVAFGLEGIADAAAPSALSTSLTLRGAFGTLAMSNAHEVPNGLRALAGAGAPTITDVVTGFTTAGPLDSIVYTTPTFSGGFALGLQITDESGYGVGTKNSNAQAKNTVYILTYNAGAIRARADVTQYGSPRGATQFDNRTRISGNYNLGVATIGAGFSTRKTVAGAKEDQNMLSVSVPMGAYTFGVTTQAHTAKDVAGVKTKSSGNSVGVSYALSKRTSITAQTASYKTKPAVSAKETNVFLTHNF